MLNEPGNPNIEDFDGAVPKLTIRSFDRLKPTMLALGFEFRWLAGERQLAHQISCTRDRSIRAKFRALVTPERRPV